jgi:hypothetical protein
MRNLLFGALVAFLQMGAARADKMPLDGQTFIGATTFEADTVSPKEGKMHWKGTLTPGGLEGTAVWSKPGQKDIEYWFKATAKRK